MRSIDLDAIDETAIQRFGELRKKFHLSNVFALISRSPSKRLPEKAAGALRAAGAMDAAGVHDHHKEAERRKTGGISHKTRVQTRRRHPEFGRTSGDCTEGYRENRCLRSASSRLPWLSSARTKTSAGCSWSDSRKVRPAQVSRSRPCAELCWLTARTRRIASARQTAASPRQISRLPRRNSVSVRGG